jgi:hypothetical protein
VEEKEPSLLNITPPVYYICNGISIVKAGFELWTVRALKNGGWCVMSDEAGAGRDRRLTGGVKAVRVARSGLRSRR